MIRARCARHTVRFALASALLLVGSTTLPAAGPRPREPVQAKIAAEPASLRAIYEHLHAHPELSFMEVNTAALIAKELRALGIEVTEKVGRLGVVGVLRNGPGPTVLLRTDMDALPLKETTGVALRQHRGRQGSAGPRPAGDARLRARHAHDQPDRRGADARRAARSMVGHDRLHRPAGRGDRRRARGRCSTTGSTPVSRSPTSP